MIATTIARKEVLLVRRDRRFRFIFLALLLVMLGAVLLGAARTDTFERERANALAADRSVWLDQGARNPHSAAHFSRYAFKPIPVLATLDPGSTDYAGLAVWMEAHSRNPATFRYAEGGGALSRFATLSPAWVMQTLTPLVIILLLFASYAGEREDGTLRQLLSSGASVGAVFWGKLRGALTALGWIYLPLAVLAVVAVTIIGGGAAQTDLLLRLVLMLLSYGVYLFAFAVTAMGISALCSTRRVAAIALFTFWFFATVLMPRLSADVATSFAPQPDGFEVSNSIDRIGSAFWNDETVRANARQEALDEYGVASADELPINYAAYELQASEVYGDRLFDEEYADLDAGHAAQEAVVDALALVSPTIAIKRLSAGLAGTDRLHHLAFLAEAETHRRQIIKQMNDDMMHNAGDAGYSYQSDPAFWQEIADFSGTTPLLRAHLATYLWPFLLLLLWALGAYLFARRAVARASNLESAK